MYVEKVKNGNNIHVSSFLHIHTPPILTRVRSEPVDRNLKRLHFESRDRLKTLGAELQACREVLESRRLPFSTIAPLLSEPLQDSLADGLVDSDGFQAAFLMRKSAEERWQVWLDGHQPLKWKADRRADVEETHTGKYSSGFARLADAAPGEEEEEEGDEKEFEEDWEMVASGAAEKSTQAVAQTQEHEVVAEAAVERDAETILDEEKSAWHIPPQERLLVYAHLEEHCRQEAQENMVGLARRYRDAHRECKALRERNDLETLKSASIIGLTTTGASKHQHLLTQLGVKVVMVEEAAEVLEAHVLACLSDSVEQLILIGDHLQLRPKIESYELTVVSGRGYDLDLSLFERLTTHEEQKLGGRAPHLVQLKEQRWMRPEIADLIRLEVYPELQDHPSLRGYPPVSGMRSNIFFMAHYVMEDGVATKPGALPDDTLSKSNRHEVTMVTALTCYLLKQGYRAGEITVLTPYLRQLFELRAALSKVVVTYTDERDELALETLALEGEEETQGEEGRQGAESAASPSALYRASAKDRVRMATIDNFQGEESTIVVISLVRSNPQGNIGFLKMANRVNVLLSRAKHGMYLIGNPETLGARPEGNIWPAVLDCLETRNQVRV